MRNVLGLALTSLLAIGCGASSSGGTSSPSSVQTPSATHAQPGAQARADGPGEWWSGSCATVCQKLAGCQPSAEASACQTRCETWKTNHEPSTDDELYGCVDGASGCDAISTCEHNE